MLIDSYLTLRHIYACVCQFFLKSRDSSSQLNIEPWNWQNITNRNNLLDIIPFFQACKLKNAFDFDPEPPEVPPRGLRPATFHPPPPPPPNEYPEPAYLQEEINSLKAETYILQEQIGKQEAELNLHRAALGSLREERDRYYRKVCTGSRFIWVMKSIMIKLLIYVFIWSEIYDNLKKKGS